MRLGSLLAQWIKIQRKYARNRKALNLRNDSGPGHHLRTILAYIYMRGKLDDALYMRSLVGRNVSNGDESKYVVSSRKKSGYALVYLDNSQQFLTLAGKNSI